MDLLFSEIWAKLLNGCHLNLGSVPRLSTHTLVSLVESWTVHTSLTIPLCEDNNFSGRLLPYFDGRDYHFTQIDKSFARQGDAFE